MRTGVDACRAHFGVENTEGIEMACATDICSSDYTDEEASEPGQKVLNIDVTNNVPWRSESVSKLIFLAERVEY